MGNTISEHDIGVLIKHHCGNRLRKKTALLTLPYVINANYIIHPWRRQTNNGEIIKGKDKRLSGMVGAPILIDGIKYLCNISLKKSANGKVRPYALTLKDGNGNIVENEKMDSTLQVPDSNSEPTTSGNAHFDKVTTSPDTNPSTNANIDKNNKTDKNESKNMNKKNTIRLTESDLKRIITESVKRVLRENNEDVITIGSPEYGEKGFRVELGNGGLHSVKFNVYAYNGQDALDAAVDYAERKGWNGLFWDEDESVEEYPDDFITAGNHCHSLRSDCFIVRPLNESYKRRNRR